MTSDGHILIGIVKGGIPGCGGNNQNSPSVFVRVSHIRKWINTITCTLPNLTYSKNTNVSENVHGNNVTIQNTTIQNGAVVKIYACNNNVYGVTVMPGGTLELDAGGSVLGYENIKVMEGARFVIE